MPDSDKAKPTPLHELLGWQPPADATKGANGATAAGSSSPAPAAGSPTPATSSAPGAAPARDTVASRAAGSQPAIAGRTNHHFAVMDGSNVAHSGEGDGARLANIIAVRDKLVEDGYEPLIVVDAALRHQIDDQRGYEELVRQGAVKQAPAGTDADYFILAFAKELDAHIVSNDQFRDRSKLFAAVRSRVIRYMVLANEVVFDKRTSRREKGRH